MYRHWQFPTFQRQIEQGHRTLDLNISFEKLQNTKPNYDVRNGHASRLDVNEAEYGSGKRKAKYTEGFWVSKLMGDFTDNGSVHKLTVLLALNPMRYSRFNIAIVSQLAFVHREEIGKICRFWEISCPLVSCFFEHWCIRINRWIFASCYRHEINSMMSASIIKFTNFLWSPPNATLPKWKCFPFSVPIFNKI